MQTAIYAGLGAVVALVVVLGASRGGDGDDIDEFDAVAELRGAYADGEIKLWEFEDALEAHFSADQQALRRRLEAIDGVGPEQSAALAEHFGSIEALRVATQTELEVARGIGPMTARRIKESVGEDETVKNSTYQ